MFLGDELQVCLGALQPAFAEWATGTDRDHRLNGVEALAKRIRCRIKQRADAVLLVIMHQRPLHFGLADLVLKRCDGTHGDHGGKQHRHDQLETKAREINDEQPRREDQHSSAEVRLFGDQTHRHDENDQPDHEVVPAHHAFATLVVPRQHQGRGYLHDFGRLDHDTHIDPALGPLAREAEHRDCH